MAHHRRYRRRTTPDPKRNRTWSGRGGTATIGGTEFPVTDWSIERPEWSLYRPSRWEFELPRIWLPTVVDMDFR